MLVVSLKLTGFIPFIFFPESDRPLVTANIELPIGTSIESTTAAVDEIETFVHDQLATDEERTEGVVSWSSYIGQGAPKYDLGYNPPEAAPYSAHVLLNTTSDSVNQHVIDRLEDFCLEHFPEMSATISKLQQGGGSAQPIAIRVSGKQMDKLNEIIEQIKGKLAAIPGSKNIQDDWGLRSKKLLVKVDQAKAQLAGITSQDIVTSLQTLLGGMEVERFREEDKSIPIVIRRELSDTPEIDRQATMNLYNQQTGQSVPLKQVADIQVVWEASKILRRDQYRTMTVFSEVETGYTAAEVLGKIRPWLVERQKEWGAGYWSELGGEAEQSQKAIVAAAKQRFRPILLTTATTFLGLIPLWIGGGEMWQPMAIGIIFGLLFATVITLLFLPVLYRLMFRVRI